MRRFVQQEDHALALMQRAGLPSPEREYPAAQADRRPALQPTARRPRPWRAGRAFLAVGFLMSNLDGLGLTPN